MQAIAQKVSARFNSNKIIDLIFALIVPVIATLAALLVGAILLVILDVDPLEAYEALLNGATGLTEDCSQYRSDEICNRIKVNTRSDTLVKAISLIFVGIGICIAFRGGVINIGGEGQMLAGAVAGTAVAIHFESPPFQGIAQHFSDFPQIATVTLAMLAGFIGGAFWGGIAGVLKAYFNVNEILSTIMLNQIAFQLMTYLLNGPMQSPDEAAKGAGQAKTVRIAEHAKLPRISPFTDVEGIRLNAGIYIAIILAIFIYIFLWQTTFGYRIRAVGKSERASRYAGIKVKRQMLYAMLWAGGFAGLAGVSQVVGIRYVLQSEGAAAEFTGNAGFNGIVAALFGGLHPIGTIPAAIFFGGMLTGGPAMQRAVQVNAALITAINGILVVFVVSSQIFIRRRSRRRVTISETTSTADNKPSPQTEPIPEKVDREASSNDP